MKNDIRKFALNYRKNINTIELSKKIHENLFSLQEWKRCNNIFCYYSVNYEVNTTELFSYKKNWYIPRIQDKELLVCKFDSDKLVCNKYNIPEPTNAAIDPNIIDMAIIPAVAADKDGYRIGYGGGYYDRFLSKFGNNICKVVLVYSSLLYDTIYPDSFDVKSDIIVTDEKIYKINC